jgi:hypothetical protein
LALVEDLDREIGPGTPEVGGNAKL